MKHLKTYEGNTVKENLSIIKKYIYTLNRSNIDDNHHLAMTYFIILYNFLIIEEIFHSDVVLHSKELNKYLDLEKLDDNKEIYEVFIDLYNVHSEVRNNIETFDNIPIITEVCSEIPSIYNTILKKKDIDKLKMKKDVDKYNL